LAIGPESKNPALARCWTEILKIFHRPRPRLIRSVLSGARRITIAGTYAYILCDRGLVVVDISNPLDPRVTAEIGAPDLVEPQGVAVQFRYAFVVDRQD